MTTAGSLALAGATPPKDAFIVDRAARGRRGHPRQDESQRVGELPIDALDQRLERTRRADEESVRARSQPVGIELGIRRRDRREPRRGRRRHRDRRLDRVAVQQQRPRRHQADARPAEPQRHRADRAQPGHGRPDDAHRRRRRRASRRDGRRRSRRSGHERRPRTHGLRRRTTRRHSMPNGLKGARIGVVRNRLFGYSPAADRSGRSRDRRR